MKELFINGVKALLKIYPEKYREYYQILVVYKVNQFSKTKRKAFLNEVKRRQALSIFDIEPLSQELSSYSDQYYYVNSRYAIGHHISTYAKWDKPINAVIEHGVYKDDAIMDIEVHKNKFPAIFTFGPIRHKFLTNVIGHNKAIYKLGPHIAYVDSLLNEDELLKMKSELGTVLLAFPTHSIESHKVEFDYKNWIKEIKKRGEGFDTILVNVYFQDVIFGRHQPYLDAGFKVVTSGHRSDLNFLPRLKSIIQLSDMSMSNHFSTAVGYCLHLNVPHYVYQQELEFQITEQALDSHANNKVEDDVKHVDAFRKYAVEITPKQMEIYNQVWGGEDSIKTPKELYTIFEALDRKKPFWL